MNAADRRRQRQQADLEARRVARYHAALADVLQTETGRLVLWELLRRSGLYASVFDTQSLRMAALAGQQTFGQEILADVIAVDEDGYALMQREARQRARMDEAEFEAAEMDERRRREEE